MAARQSLFVTGATVLAATVAHARQEVHLEFSDLGSDATSFCCGSHHTCALYDRESEAPGNGNIANPAGAGNKPMVEFGHTLCWGREFLQQTDPPDDQQFVQISCGGSFTCGLSFDEQVTCWGGIGGAGMSGQFVQVSAGLDHACAVSLDGRLSCVGRNSRGESSPPNPADTLPQGERFVQVSAGKTHSCALTNTGGVVCWGSNERGQCDAPASPSSVREKARPDGDGEENQEPVAFKQVVASLGKHTCALEQATGFVQCWGGARSGAAKPPANVAFLSLAAGRKFTCGIRASDGGVQCWGRISKTPKEGGPFSQLSAGEDHACASTVSGELRCWGQGSYSKTATPDQLAVLG
eukprot:INCI19594.1.p1 GENE.INCI19594.1~~INCI19594.1.p1  ORF type:complete len:353 (+),score=62.69 INCI19594.1:151-1209(+)